MNRQQLFPIKLFSTSMSCVSMTVFSWNKSDYLYVKKIIFMFPKWWQRKCVNCRCFRQTVWRTSAVILKQVLFCEIYEILFIFHLHSCPNYRSCDPKRHTQWKSVSMTVSIIYLYIHFFNTSWEQLKPFSHIERLFPNLEFLCCDRFRFRAILGVMEE